MKKIVNLGKGQYGQVYCKIEITKAGRLSITGVEGPMSNGNCKGACGQILDHIVINEYAPGWDHDLLVKFLDVWDRWHLNDMRPGCEHQRGWGKKTIKVNYYNLNRDIRDKQEAIRKEFMCKLSLGKEVMLTPDEIKILIYPVDLTVPGETDNEEYNLARANILKSYTLKRTKTEFAANVYPTIHPEGVLTKPCPICGYEYGTSWLKEDLPHDIIYFLEGLPDSDVIPAWV